VLTCISHEPLKLSRAAVFNLGVVQFR